MRQTTQSKTEANMEHILGFIAEGLLVDLGAKVGGHLIKVKQKTPKRTRQFILFGKLLGARCFFF